LLVDHDRIVRPSIVLRPEPTTLDNLQPQEILEAVGHLRDAEFDFAASPPIATAGRRPELIGRQHRASHAFDLRELLEREEELTHRFLLVRAEEVVGRLLHVDVDVPHTLD
jgi:hypothetical protein